MRTTYMFVAICLILISCSEDEKPTSLRCYVLSDVNFRSNIAVYDYPAKKLTENFYSSSNVGSILTANINSDNIYINTSNPSTLRRIDLSSGTEKQSIKSWAYYDQVITFHGADVVFCNLQFDGPATSSIKIYDESLSLKDSIAFPIADGLTAATVINNRLFISLYGNGHAYLQIYDFSTGTFLDPIDLPSASFQLLPLDKNRLLTIFNDKYFIIDAQTLLATDPVTSYVGRNPAVFDPSDNKLIWLSPMAQPALNPFYLSAMDLTTGESTALNNGRESIVGPLTYDAQSKLILGGPGISVFSRAGTQLDKVETSSPTKFIFIK